MCEIALRPTMQCLFPQLKSSFTVYGVTLPSPLLAALEYAPPMLGTWPRFSVPSVSPPKVNLIPGGGVGANSGHANNDVKPCIGTFEIKTPNRRKERLPISDTGWGRTPEREAKKRTTDTMERIPLQLEQQSDQAGVLESTINPNAAADVQNSASSPAPASVTAVAALRFEEFNETRGYASVCDAAFLCCLPIRRQ